MKINVTAPVGTLVTGDSIVIKPNSVNYWVGLNGSGKTMAMSGLAHHVYSLLKQKGNWNTRPLPKFENCFTHEGFDSVTSVTHFTAKARQSQWLDIEMSMESAAGINALWQSEGQNAQSELTRAIRDHLNDPHHLFLFDEIDGTFDARAKYIFFNGFLAKMAGTAVVCTHDCLFPVGSDVFYFETKKTEPYLS